MGARNTAPFRVAFRSVDSVGSRKTFFRGSMPGLCAPLPKLRRHPRGCPRTARGRCGSLFLHRSGLPPPTPCRSPGAPTVMLGRARRLERESICGPNDHPFAMNDQLPSAQSTTHVNGNSDHWLSDRKNGHKFIGITNRTLETLNRGPKSQSGSTPPGYLCLGRLLERHCPYLGTPGQVDRRTPPDKARQ